MPEDAGFWVYDAKGQVAASSVLWDDASSTLPTDGYIAFAGDPGLIESPIQSRNEGVLFVPGFFQDGRRGI